MTTRAERLLALAYQERQEYGKPSAATLELLVQALEQEFPLWK